MPLGIVVDTKVERFAEPPAFEQLRVYVVGPSGVTIREPDVATLPTPLLIETLVAFVLTDHCSVTESPMVMVERSTEKLVTVGAEGTDTPATDTATEPVETPPPFVAVRT